MDKKEYELVSDGKIKGEVENVRFAWRPLEVSNRLQDQTTQFQLFLPSPSFTPEFLTEFLVNYHKHAIHILGNYSKQGNHLLFEAQRMIYAGAFFAAYMSTCCRLGFFGFHCIISGHRTGSGGLRIAF